MKLNLNDISKLVNGIFEGSGDAVITGAAGLEDAGQSDISFLGNPKYVKLVAQTRAGAVFVPQSYSGTGKNIIRVANPQLAFAKVLVLLDKEKRQQAVAEINQAAAVSEKAVIGQMVRVGPFAVVEEGASIGDNSVIMAHCYIGRNTKIGSDALIYPNVTVRENISIGKNVVMHSGAVVGADGFGFIPLGTSSFKIPQIGTVEIGDDVEIGANVTIDRATTGATRIGDGTKLDDQVHIAHNIQIGRNCLIAGQVGFAGSSKVGDNVMIGGQAGINGHIKIGSGVVIGGKALVMGDIPDNTVVSGYPAREHKENLKIQVMIGKLGEIYEEFKKLKDAVIKRKDNRL